MKAERTGIVLRPDQGRVLFRPFDLGSETRTLKIMARVCALSEVAVDSELEEVRREFDGRHKNAEVFFMRRFQQVKHHLLTDEPLSQHRMLLIGAYFTSEFSLESAALFNPSMVWHPDQSGLATGAKRFILSLRATGEGHISSIVFRGGVINPDYSIVLDENSRYVMTPELITNQVFDKSLFENKLFELHITNSISEQVLQDLNPQFTYEELNTALLSALRRHRVQPKHDPTAKAILSLALSNYEIHFDPSLALSERIIFPTSPSEMHGIEDARFVRMEDESGQHNYFATYTAYDGQYTFPQIIETADFFHFKVNTLNGPEVQNKGMALFPRKIQGRYATLGRQDGENIYIMFSDHIHFWHSKRLLLKPTYPWEYVQLGNCGSPIETKHGWVVLTHGVGAMRKYCMGAILLDLEDPTKVIGRLKEPLITPNEHEREGYVPNVVYSCGGALFRDKIIIPYAMADYASSIAMVDLESLVGQMKSDMQA